MTAVYVVLGVVAVLWVVAGINRRRADTLRQSGLLPARGQGTSADVERLVALGKRIDAIKVYREIHGTDLKSAKEAVDRLAARPDLRGGA